MESERCVVYSPKHAFTGVVILQDASRTIPHELERKQFSSDVSDLQMALQALVDGEVSAPETGWTDEREEMWRHMRDEVSRTRSYRK